MKKLNRLLDEWIQQRLLSAEQGAEICRYEQQKKTKRVSPIVFLGVFAIAVGVISIIAANWVAIPDWVKLMSDVLVLCFIAYCLVRYQNKISGHYFDGIVLLFCLLCLASIGLTSQIYHLTGPLYSAFLLWSVIVFPICLFSTTLVIPVIWVGGFLYSFVFMLADKSYAVFLHDERQVALLFLMMPFLCGTLYGCFNRFKRLSHFSSASYFFIFITFIQNVVFMDITLSTGFNIFRLSSFSYSYSLLFIVLALPVILSYSKDKIAQILVTLLVSIYALLVTLFFHVDKAPIISAILSLPTSVVLGMYFAHRGQFKLFNLFIELSAVRLWLIYLDNSHGLSTTGVGLIITGVFLIGAVLLWRRYRQAVFDWVAKEEAHHE